MNDSDTGKVTIRLGEEMFIVERDPTQEELDSPVFTAIWNAIKRWDISRESNGIYAGATGTDVRTILDAIRKAKGSTQ